jgi:hypothetical protein
MIPGVIITEEPVPLIGVKNRICACGKIIDADEANKAMQTVAQLRPKVIVIRRSSEQK